MDEPDGRSYKTGRFFEALSRLPSNKRGNGSRWIPDTKYKPNSESDKKHEGHVVNRLKRGILADWTG